MVTVADFIPLCIEFAQKHHDAARMLLQAFCYACTDPPNGGPDMPGHKHITVHRLGLAVALFAALVQIWMNLAVGIVGSEDNPVNMGFFMVVATAAACAFTARLRADGMARAMLATAGVQALLGLAVATAPSTVIADSKGPLGVLVLSGGFTALWLLAAFLFQRSARAAG